MALTNEIQFSFGDLDDGPISQGSSKLQNNIESEKLCAYNQTRECFLGLEVTSANFSSSRLKDHLNALAIKSGEGLWLTPFCGLPDSGLRMALDLIYLDEDCQVIDLVESYPTFRVSPCSPRARSVLALPAHSIYSSQTQSGDQLVLCAAEEMEQKLDRLANPRQAHSGSANQASTNSLFVATTNANGNDRSSAGSIQSAALLREEPLWSGGPGLLELGDRSLKERTAMEKPHLMGLVQPGMKTAKPPKSWLQRWWSPDPRKAPREAVPGLAAYYWTGGPAEPRSIRDISTTGLYVITEERWYPGTLVLMTLQSSEGGEEASERSICVHSRAVRWGNDGVGLQFILPPSQKGRDGSDRPISAADQREFDRFLERLRSGKQ